MSRDGFLAQLSENDRCSLLETNPPADCKLCGEHMSCTEREYERAGLCFKCAEAIANHFWHEHSGDWLTWPNQSRASKPAKAKIKTALRLKVYERDGFKCVYCGNRKQLTLDHVTAESRGGATAEGNLVTACKVCNSKKQTKSLSSFWEQQS